MIKKQWFINDDYLSEKLKLLLTDSKIKVFLCGLKRVLKFINDKNVDSDSVFDLEIGAYLLNPLKDSYFLSKILVE